MYEEIAEQIREATDDGNKTAMFHLQVLKNAHLLADIDPVDFCRKVEARDSYKVEFQKMIKRARLLKSQGLKVSDD